MSCLTTLLREEASTHRRTMADKSKDRLGPDTTLFRSDSLLCAGLLREDASKATQRAHIRFYETNPPFCNPIFYTTCYAHVSCGENGQEISVGSFWKTNPQGGGNEVGFIEKWVRLSRKYGVRRLVGQIGRA